MDMNGWNMDVANEILNICSRQLNSVIWTKLPIPFVEMLTVYKHTYTPIKVKSGNRKETASEIKDNNVHEK
jgi:hypothetical protein